MNPAKSIKQFFHILDLGDCLLLQGTNIWTSAGMDKASYPVTSSDIPKLLQILFCCLYMKSIKVKELNVIPLGMLKVSAAPCKIRPAVFLVDFGL